VSSPPTALGPSPVPLRLRYTAVEACVGIVVGLDAFAPPLGEASEPTPRAAMEQVVLEALQRPPCLVSFSGGRDSSAVLALAAHVARREGLPLPVPITNRFPAVPEADETDWQQRVVDHVGCEDWQRLAWTDELDLIGPYAQRVLARHGLAYPANLHFHEPLMEAAAGGSLLTGVGGDEIFASWLRSTARALRYERRRPPLRRLRNLAGDLLPRGVRVRREAARSGIHDLSWLRPEVRHHLATARAEAAVGTSLRWDDELDRWWRHRYVQAALGSLRALGADHGVAVFSPFTERRVLAAWAAQQGAIGLPGRRTGLTALVGDLLPPSILERRSKASFNDAFRSTYSRRFSAQRPRAGIDEQLVDVDALHAEWSKPQPHVAAAHLLRVAWLAATPSRFL
jgi:hypothetical protein